MLFLDLTCEPNALLLIALATVELMCLGPMPSTRDLDPNAAVSAEALLSCADEDGADAVTCVRVCDDKNAEAPDRGLTMQDGGGETRNRTDDAALRERHDDEVTVAEGGDALKLLGDAIGSERVTEFAE